VVDLLVQLIGNKIELASEQVRTGAQAVGRRAVIGLAGALVATVGLMLLALAGVEALGGVIASRALRLLLVALPLLGGGLFVAGRARSERRVSGAPPNERDHHRNEGQDQKHVNPRAEGVAADHAEQPQHEQERGDHPKHVQASLE
jgi:hypothetical protein